MTDPRPDPVDTLARTIWGEARGCGGPGMRHVASVILNRADHPTWWGRSITGVCLQPWQFSCRNHDDPNLSKLLAVTEADPEFAVAMQIAHRAVSGMLPDETRGADSYFALSMKTPPAWAAKARRVAVDGWHAFYVTNPNAPPGTKPDVRNVGASYVPPPESDADRLMDAELAALNPAPAGSPVPTE
jgi:spore germination cell wall hydrolase CwlJ-like protein